MRRVANLLIPLLALSTVSGCEWLRNLTGKSITNPDKVDGPVVGKTKDELVGYLNQQASYLNSVRYPRVSIDIRAGKEPYSLENSNLICSKPRNFSLVGGKTVMSELVNIGSNSNEFWMYSRFPERTYVFCSHTDFQRGSGSLPFPFDPDWALQALGMNVYDPNLPYKVDTDQVNREHKLMFETLTPQNTTVSRVVVFASDPMGEKRPQVRRHLILDANRRTIAVAEVLEVTTLNAGRDRVTQKELFVQVPTRVKLEWPQQQFTMDMKLRGAKINEGITDAEAADLFTKPKFHDIQPTNLANSQYTPGGIQRGTMPSDLQPRKRRP